MKGYSHALTGAGAWLALTSTSGAALGWYAQPTQVALAGSIVCAGAALLPDVDHPDGTIAWSLPPVKMGSLTVVPSPTMALCKGVEGFSGGHRHATHSLIGVSAFVGLAWAAALITPTIHGRSVAVGAGLLCVLLVAFAIKALGISRSLAGGRRRSLFGGVLGSWLGPWLLSVGSAGYVTWALGERWAWLPVAVGVGALLHCLGDALTVEGVPWLWPFHPKPPKFLVLVPVLGGVVSWVWQNNGYFRLPLLGKTTSLREALFALVVGLYVTYLIVFEVAALGGHYLLY